MDFEIQGRMTLELSVALESSTQTRSVWKKAKRFSKVPRAEVAKGNEPAPQTKGRLNSSNQKRNLAPPAHPMSSGSSTGTWQTGGRVDPPRPQGCGKIEGDGTERKAPTDRLAGPSALACPAGVL